jgi:hypothetical protein
MLRQAQHERKILKIFDPLPVRPEPCRRVNASFSAESLITPDEVIYVHARATINGRDETGKCDISSDIRFRGPGV